MFNLNNKEILQEIADFNESLANSEAGRELNDILEMRDAFCASAMVVAMGLGFIRTLRVS